MPPTYAPATTALAPPLSGRKALVTGGAMVEKQIADQARIHGIAEEEVVEKIMLAESSIKRLVEPTEVASLVGWLVGRDSSMVTGASYTIDGGWMAR
jgi:3-hydroxybutyrate dehydrogenase